MKHLSVILFFFIIGFSGIENSQAQITGSRTKVQNPLTSSPAVPRNPSGVELLKPPGHNEKILQMEALEKEMIDNANSDGKQSKEEYEIINRLRIMIDTLK
jgi:hypothetical protein